MVSDSSSGELYSNYVERRPHPFGERLIRSWHSRLLNHAVKSLGRPVRILEVGPGHGFFADECRVRGIDYMFCDNSVVVHGHMTQLGYEGQVALVHELNDSVGKFDMIWMSHVLEHAPTWLDARMMLEASQNLLKDGGAVVVISPDTLSWRLEFWNVDATHGYPTTLRNVSQLMSDVGLMEVNARHHRSASFRFGWRALACIVSYVPHQLVDPILSRRRYRVRDGFFYSWKAVFGWRQIMVTGRKPTMTFPSPVTSE